MFFYWDFADLWYERLCLKVLFTWFLQVVILVLTACHSFTTFDFTHIYLMSPYESPDLACGLEHVRLG